MTKKTLAILVLSFTAFSLFASAASSMVLRVKSINEYPQFTIKAGLVNDTNEITMTGVQNLSELFPAFDVMDSSHSLTLFFTLYQTNKAVIKSTYNVEVALYFQSFRGTYKVSNVTPLLERLYKSDNLSQTSYLDGIHIMEFGQRDRVSGFTGRMITYKFRYNPGIYNPDSRDDFELVTMEIKYRGDDSLARYSDLDYSATITVVYEIY